MHEMRAQVLGQEALLEKEMTVHSCWKIKGQGNLACYSSWGHKTVRHDLATKQKHSFLVYISKSVSMMNV